MRKSKRLIGDLRVSWQDWDAMDTHEQTCANSDKGGVFFACVERLCHHCIGFKSRVVTPRFSRAR